MLMQVELGHFKCFERLILPLSKLTLLSGGNASGKSSVLQALVLLHQTAVDAEWSHDLLLNGSVTSLGSVNDVVDKITGQRSLTIGLSTAKARCRWLFKGLERRDLSIPLDSLTYWEGDAPPYAFDMGNATQLRHLIPLDLRARSAEAETLAQDIVGISYIGAERIGPRETYPLGDRHRHRTVGPQGESAIGLLYWRGDDPEQPIEEALRIGGALPTLLRQTDARLQTFFPGTSLEVLPVQNANRVTLGIRTSDDTTFHRPQHVGYGLTHILPIIVAGLAAAPGQVVLVENPEVHLHPAGQALMGRFLAEVAASGVQVVLETHSDHILNGIRRAVRGKLLARHEVALHFFTPRGAAKGEVSQVISPQIDDAGNLDHWPTGFFDQFDKDMSYFAGWED